MARKAADRPVPIQQPKYAAPVRVPAAPVRIPAAEAPLRESGPSGFDAARVQLAKVIEKNIEELISSLEELWMPSGVSVARNQERLAETSRILVQMDTQTKNLVNFLEDHDGFCKAYVSTPSPCSPWKLSQVFPLMQSKDYPCSLG